KNDIIRFGKKTTQRKNLPAHWDGTASSYRWRKDGRKIYFTDPLRGTVQLFELEWKQAIAVNTLPNIAQISEGQFDITSVVGEVDGSLIVTSTTLTRATEIYRYDLKKKALTAITDVNDNHYNRLA